MPKLDEFAVAGWSVTQFIYLGPVIWLSYRSGRKQRAKGILIVAGIGVLLNGGCDLVLVSFT